MSNATVLLFGAYELLPEGTDVFAYLSTSLQSSFYADAPSSFKPQAYLCMALISFSVPLFIVAYLRRARRIRQFLPFRLLRTPRGTFVVPHFVLSWQFFSIIFLCVLLPYAYYMVRFGSGHEVPNYLLWIALAWLPVFWAALSAFWSLAVALAMASMELGGKERWTNSAHGLNTLFITIVTCASIANVATSTVAQHYYTVTHNAYVEVTKQLGLHSAAFSTALPSTTIELELYALISPFQTLLHLQPKLDTAFRVAYGIWLLMLLTLVIIYALVAPRYFLQIRKEIRSISGFSDSQRISTFKTRSRSSRDSDPAVRLRRAYTDMILGSVTIFVGCLIYFAECLSLVINGLAGSNKPGWYAFSVLAGLYTVVLCAFPSSVFALYRALHMPTTPSTNHAGTVIAKPVSPRVVGNSGVGPVDLLVTGRGQDSTLEIALDARVSSLYPIRVDVRREVQVEREGSSIGEKEDEVERFEGAVKGDC